VGDIPAHPRAYWQKAEKPEIPETQAIKELLEDEKVRGKNS